MLIDGNLILGFIGGLVAVLGGVWTAYRLLGHSVFRELDQHRERMNMIQTQANRDAKSLSDRINREVESRHQTERASVAARVNLSSRVQHLESELSRGSVNARDD